MKSLADHLREKFQVESNRDSENPLGYPLTRFQSIYNDLRGIQPGFYLVAGGWNYGKTAFLVNLFLDLLTSSPDLKGLFLSLDDKRNYIINRLLGIMTGISLNKLKRKQNSPHETEKLKIAYDRLIHWAEEGKLSIKDIQQETGIITLEEEIESHIDTNSSDPNLVVFIDGWKNLELLGFEEHYNQLDEPCDEQANRLKNIVSEYKIPLFLTSGIHPHGIDGKSLRLEDVIRVTGRFGNNADLVWIISPKDDESYDYDSLPIMEVKFAKNRFSHVREIRNFRFNRSTSEWLEPDR
ncbi:hypothetical protein KAJ27_16985 [bacterium]|nr:hypothetical protein [bacterium]